jgi:excisionase family DNA binding protein
MMKRLSKGDIGNQKPISRLLTVSEVAEILNVHPNTVRHWSNVGILKACRVGHRRDRRFKLDEVNKLIDNNRP